MLRSKGDCLLHAAARAAGQAGQFALQGRGFLLLGGVPVFDGIALRYKRVLWTVIGIDGVMFLTEMVAGQLAGSQAFKADALDFLGDTVTYGLSLAVIGASLETRATAALFKDCIPVGQRGPVSCVWGERVRDVLIRSGTSSPVEQTPRPARFETFEAEKDQTRSR